MDEAAIRELLIKECHRLLTEWQVRQNRRTLEEAVIELKKMTARLEAGKHKE